MPTAASPNAVAESIQHSQQSKSQRLRVSAGITRVACRSRPHSRRLRLRGVDGRRHPRQGDPYRSPHCQSARACTSTGGTSAAAARLSCSVGCNSWAWVRRGRWQFPTTGFKWRDLPARRGGGYDLSRSLVAGVTTSRRKLRPAAVPRGGGYDLAAGVAPPSATHTGRRESACPPPQGRIASKSPTVIIPRPLEGLISPRAELSGGETTSRRELLLPPRLHIPATRACPPPPRF